MMLRCFRGNVLSSTTLSFSVSPRERPVARVRRRMVQALLVVERRRMVDWRAVQVLRVRRAVRVLPVRRAVRVMLVQVELLQLAWRAVPKLPVRRVVQVRRVRRAVQVLRWQAIRTVTAGTHAYT